MSGLGELVKQLPGTGLVKHAGEFYAKELTPVKHAEPTLERKEKIVRAAGEKVGINYVYLWGIFGTETNYGNDSKTSSAGAEGPFQFEPETAKAYGYPLGVNNSGTITDWKAFEEQAEAAARYLKASGINKNPRAAIEIYNSGKAGGAPSYYQSVLAHAKSFLGIETTGNENKAETEKVENPQTSESSIWSKLQSLGVAAILLLGAVFLMVYGVMLAVGKGAGRFKALPGVAA